MIVGVGVDIIEIDRIERACQKDSFVKRIFTQNEILICGNRNYKSFAGNFAVKEAVAKVLGTGFSGFSPRDIEVLRNDFGMPFVVLSDGALEICHNLKIEKIFVSISHNLNSAVGFAVAER